MITDVNVNVEEFLQCVCVYLLEEWNQIRSFFITKTKQERERERENESGPPWISQQNRSIKRFLRGLQKVQGPNKLSHSSYQDQGPLFTVLPSFCSEGTLFPEMKFIY